ncbi:MAG: ERCC4 domain-containing protein [Gemmatimonadales bacterium]
MSGDETLWVVTRTGVGRFPFRIALIRGDETLLAVRTQSAWPGPGQQVFCLRDRGGAPSDATEQERVRVISATRLGRKLAVVLDRPTRKRAEFLSIVKPRPDGAGSVEQLFFRTESGIRAHRSRARVELLGKAGTEGTVLIDTAERYPWSFPHSPTIRRKLAVGDYALLRDGRVVAAVERKSFDNLLADIGAIQALHHAMADLATLGRASVVVEAEYGDFVDPVRLAGRWPPAHVGRVLAELAVLHPTLPIVFAGNRKLANGWTAAFFEAADRDASAAAQPQLTLLAEPAAPAYPGPSRPLGRDDEVRREAGRLASIGPFAGVELARLFPDLSVARVNRVLVQLAEEGILERSGARRGTRWHRRR